MESKTCRICGELKPLAEFHRAAGMRDGHRSECKPCFRAISAARYRANPEPVKERARRWQQENPERHRANQQRYRADGRKAAKDRASYLKRTFGITVQQYDEMLAAQGGVCFLCRRPPTAWISLHVDHDHESGAIRKLLCFRCNNALGDLDDDPDLLARAAAYLADHDPEVRRLAALAQERVRALRR